MIESLENRCLLAAPGNKELCGWIALGTAYMVGSSTNTTFGMGAGMFVGSICLLYVNDKK